jgi:transposase
MDVRKQKAEQIVKQNAITKTDKGWSVMSQSGNGSYVVKQEREGFTCSCPDFQLRQQPCKHAMAISMMVLKWFDNKGKKILEVKRITYSQNWSAYNLSQITEKEMFIKLLADLCKETEESLYDFGRPKLSVSDMVFASALKVYTTFSLRRFMTDMRMALKDGYITQVCSYSSVSNYMRDEKLTPILKQLITLSSLPLRSIENKFAIDSTGFRTTKFNDYCREKHNTGKQHEWVKLHICTGTKTNVITSAEVGFENHSADSPQFIPLAQQTYENGFDMQEVSADKAYSSRDNLAFIDQIGGMPFIPFKSNTTGKRRGDGGHIWRKMYDFFTYRREEFLEHYHARSNVESTMNMIKTKFTDLIRSKDKTSRINEALLKVFCHNIVVLIQSINELGIEPNFIQKGV